MQTAFNDAQSGITDELAEEVSVLLRQTAQSHARTALASSFSAEDMILVDLIFRDGLDIEIFMLDTGRLHEETHDLVAEVRRHYGAEISVYFPETAALEVAASKHGPNAFLDSVDLRLQCCALRKVEPLRRALKGKGAWITGQRQQQSKTRKELPIEEWDQTHGLYKINPLAAWTTDDVWAYIRAHAVPYNPLHDQGYASIGCAPCTRAISAGEDIRAGRWWWEGDESKECGLHSANNNIAHGADNAHQR